MKVYVQGLWHLGTTTAACLASLGHEVVGIDYDKDVVYSLNDCKPTIFEPGLEEMVKAGRLSNKLSFTSLVYEHADAIDFLWITYDTPVNEDDEADVKFVMSQIEITLPFLATEAMVLVSSQMPIGSIKQLEEVAAKLYPEKNLHFAYSPENLRLGNALNVFLKPDRIVVGVRSEQDREKVASLLHSITENIEWMSVESAEMTKHAINSWLAMSVAFANEIATICEKTGADAKEVERGLKSEQRIGKKAYLSPGSAFSGGTLARDIEFIKDVGKEHQIQSPLLEAVKISNDAHKLWVRNKIQELYPNLKDVVITVWGITYKAGTDTLRRSLWVELINWLIEKGAKVRVYDPVVKTLPKEWDGVVERFDNPIASLMASSALVIGTELDFKKDFDYIEFASNLTVIDMNRSLSLLANNEKIKYISVGTIIK